MLKRFRQQKETEFDDAIERILLTMNEHEVGAPEYTKALVFLERMTTIRKESKPEGVSRDTIAIVTGNLVGILVIVFAEQNHVVVSKGLNFILKPKNRSITV